MTSRAKLQRWIGRGLAGLVGLLVVVVLCGVIYQQWATARDSRAYPPPGQLVDVGGYEMHLHCMGQGEPTVILEAALGTSVLSWKRAQEEVAMTTRVCTYDRSGIGWSDQAPVVQDAQQVVDTLRVLLENASIDGPYVMVGHSLGGLLVRIFAKKYSSDVAGMVLVDSSHEGQRPRLPAEIWTVMDGYQALLGRMRRLAPLGVLRFTSMDDVSGYLPEADREAGIALGHRSHAVDAIYREWVLFNTTSWQVLEPGFFGEMPLIVLTRGKPVSDVEAPGLSVTARQEFMQSWNELQSELAALSFNNAHVIAGQSEHYIMIDQPELVVDAIQRTVEAARSGSRIAEQVSESGIEE